MQRTFLLTILFILLSSFNLVAQENSAAFSSYTQFAQSEQNSLNDATNRIKQETAGRILSAKTVSKNGQKFYQIKVLLPSGKIQVFKVSSQ